MMTTIHENNFYTTVIDNIFGFAQNGELKRNTIK
jgi:hypothetical protein